MAFTPIGNALGDKMSKDAPLKNQLEAAGIVEAAEEVFKARFKENAVHVKPLFLKNRTLTVTCSSSAVAQEIRLNQAQIVKDLNKKIGKKEIDRLRYLA